MTESSTVHPPTEEEWAWYFEQAEYRLRRAGAPPRGTPAPTGPRRLSDRQLSRRINSEWSRRNPGAGPFIPGLDDALEDEIEMQAEAEYQAALAAAGLSDPDPDMGR